MKEVRQIVRIKYFIIIIFACNNLVVVWPGLGLNITFTRSVSSSKFWEQTSENFQWKESIKFQEIAATVIENSPEISNRFFWKNSIWNFK